MNLEEVAKRAKVSTATVSRVLNNIGPVRTATRARVLRAVEELKYHPNLHARNLAGGKSRTIGMIVSNMENPFFVDIYRAAEEAARASGYEILLANTDYRPEHLVSSIHLMIGRRVSGLALIVSEMDPGLLQELSDRDTPVVFYDVGSVQKNISNIAVNYAKGIERVVNYLHDLGHQRMAFVGHHPGLGPLGARERAFRETVARYSPIEWKVVANMDGIDGGRDAAREILQSGFHPTAVICTNDFMALGVLHELREAGLQIPREISVTGFDNIKLGEISAPSLTTLHIPRARIGQLMFQLLREGQESTGEAGKELVIDPEFVLRGSTGPAIERGRAGKL
ncbi:MAG TPA: LacI family DNA-binding transcriptional regulator [Bryobacteraceae bacterium]|jgi:DNA-binding LacI/PurR family transcriptional regulator|nr:LacI family DNA-binding transcriptional regulator [Bryobacteraceae bacterium]